VQNDRDGLTLRGVLAEQVHDRQGLRGIERRDGFVRQQDRGLNCQRAGEQDTGAFAA